MLTGDAHAPEDLCGAVIAPVACQRKAGDATEQQRPLAAVVTGENIDHVDPHLAVERDARGHPAAFVDGSEPRWRVAARTVGAHEQRAALAIADRRVDRAGVELELARWACVG